MAAFLLSGTIWSLAFWFLFSVIGIYVLTYYLVYVRQTKRWEQSNIPFLRPTFLIGQKYLLKLSNYSITVPIDQIYQENSDKDVMGFFLGVLPVILVKNPKLIQNVFSQSFDLPFMIDSSFVLREGGRIISPEEGHDLLRKRVSPIYAGNWYQGPRFESIRESIKELRHIAKKAELGGSSFDVFEVARKAIQNLSCSNFGIHSQSDEVGDRLWTIVEEAVEASHRRSIIFFSAYLFPFLQVFDTFKAWSRRSFYTLFEIIQHQIKSRDHNSTEPRDYVDVLLSLRSKEEPTTICDKDSDVLSISRGVLAEMTALGLPMLVLGSEVLQRLFIFTIHTLSLHPECQRKIRSEVLEALRKHGVSELNFDVVRSLSFVNACIKESLRLYPVLPILVKKCSEDFQIPGTNYIFRKGDSLVMPLYSGNRDQMNFKDPHSFCPERYNLENTKKTVPEIFLSYGIGPRKCPGYPPGVFALAAFVASLVQQYDIKPRSHLELMDSTDFLPQGFGTIPRRNLFVDLVRCENKVDA